MRHAFLHLRFTSQNAYIGILKNEKAGIDITIPEYKEVSGRLGLSNEEEYHIIVITRLPHFKTESHQPADVVQFMVIELHHCNSVLLGF
ncbi:HCLS1-binding protein 3 [Holothuria leucospilota]|uniref:HCLS1-binding protein 3 n=1 Tax=Holothuria leucospilota TaxID=206669 RepID=A0A9Q0YDC0_HOLLE|nr:HCLS1-binding protein 3 [Holothuria leucospilota]